MPKLIVLLIAVLLSNTSFSAELDSVIVLKTSPFFSELLTRKKAIATLPSTPFFRFINTTHPTLKTRGYQFIKTSRNLYLYFSGSGLLYEWQKNQDSLIVFKRIDQTEDFNYNIEAFLFARKNDIYNMGGYGFWKSTGTLRKYNTKDAEWDADPIKEEVHIPFDKELCWFNPATERLFIPYQQIVNTGIQAKSGEDEFDKQVYRFDLANKTWEKLGKTNAEFLEILANSTWKIPTDFGLLVCNNDKVYQINYEENTISEYSNASFVQMMVRINHFQLKYYTDGTIYYLNGKTWHYDSLKVPMAKFGKTGIKIWRKNNPYLLFGFIPVFLMVVFAAKKIRSKKTKESKSADMNPTGFNAKIRFNETEKQLLQLMLEKTKSNNTTTIAEINYVLGIKDKNIGLQKKVRSDIINSINEKFGFLNKGQKHLIGNIRSESDKRFFEYFVEHENIVLLESILSEPEN